MSVERIVNNLSRLVRLREREVDRLSGELVALQALRVRYQNNLERMEHLLATAADSDRGSPILSNNSARYKSLLIDMISNHRYEMMHHEVTIEAGRQALNYASLQQKRLDSVLQNKRQFLNSQLQVREQKKQDQFAAQAWCRVHFHAQENHRPR